MSLGYPTLRPTPDGSNVVSTSHDGEMGVPAVMMHGFQAVKNDLGQTHPLEFSLSQWSANQEKMDFAMLRNMQGLHAPLKIQMERNTARQFGRLPGMNSSGLMIDHLNGKLDTIDFEDIFNPMADAEIMGDTHALVEKKANLI